jgi:hypothetical protein
MTYAYSTWEYAADAYLFKLQRLQNRNFLFMGNLDRSTLVREMHAAFIIPYMYYYITKLCKTQAEVIINHWNLIVYGTGQGEAMHRKYKRLKLGDSQAKRTSSVSEWLH